VFSTLLKNSNIAKSAGKKNKIGDQLAKLRARRCTVSHALCIWAWPCWKMKNLPGILNMASNSYCYLLCWFWLGLDNYQTGVDQF